MSGPVNAPLIDPYAESGGTALRINGLWLGTVLQGGLSFVLWPDDYEGWRAGLASLLLGAGTLISAGMAFSLMIHVHRRAKVIAEFARLGVDPSSARLADTEALKRAGMVP